MVFITGRTIEERCPFSSTGLTVQYIVYDESRNVHASGSATEIPTTGVYYTSFVPDNVGDWTLYFYNTATGERHTYHYPIYDEEDDQSGTHNIEIAHGTSETVIVENVDTNIYSLSFYIDLNTLITASEGGTVILRLQNMIDETNYRTVAKVPFVVGSSEEHPNFEFERLHHNSQITIQLSTAVTAQRSCPFRCIIRSRGG